MAKQELNLGRNWYVLHTSSGYEDAVITSLKSRIDSFDIGDKVFNIMVPSEKKAKMKNGKKTVKEEKMYPGYVFVEMIVDDNSWYVVRNTPHVTGFIGTGSTPLPVDQKDIEMILSRMETQEPQYNIDLKVGDIVKVTDGPFKNFEGKIMEVDPEKGKVKVGVSIFGRETSTEINFLQVNKL